MAARRRPHIRASDPLHGGGSYNWKRLENALTDVLLYVLSELVRVFPAAPDEPLQRVGKQLAPRAAEYLCLFSGGADSLTGILTAHEALPNLQGVFCAHADQGKIVKIVEYLATAAFDPIDLQLRKISVPPVGVRGYAQLRGFLYCVAAASWMHLVGAHTLIVTECGPTMYQPMFSPLDSVTMTTHPVILHHAKIVIEAVLGRNIRLVTPFENLTKAEVIALCPRPDLLPHSHSCISQRFGSHDGTCYGCVIRRLACIAAGVPDVAYNRDPICNDRASAGNLLTLLTYCHDILTAYEQMETFEVEKIERYFKFDLFRRFALDQFAAIHALLRRRVVVTSAEHHIYMGVVNCIGADSLDARLDDLRAFSTQVDWRRSPPSG
jgi:hypothetical protein